MKPAGSDPGRAARLVREAQHATQSITSRRKKWQALAELVKAVASTNFAWAEQIALSAIGDEERPGHGLLRLTVWLWKQRRFDAAERAAHAITSKYWRSRALAALARESAATDLDRAERIAQDIPGRFSKAVTLRTVRRIFAAPNIAAFSLELPPRYAMVRGVRVPKPNWSRTSTPMTLIALAQLLVTSLSIQPQYALPAMNPEVVFMAYGLPTIILLPTAAYLGWRFGPKNIFTAGLLAFTAGALGDAYFLNSAVAAFSLLLAGIGTAFVVVNGLGILLAPMGQRQHRRLLGIYCTALICGIAAGAFESGAHMHGRFFVDGVIGLSLAIAALPIGEWGDRDHARLPGPVSPLHGIFWYRAHLEGPLIRQRSDMAWALAVVASLFIVIILIGKG